MLAAVANTSNEGNKGCPTAAIVESIPAQTQALPQTQAQLLHTRRHVAAHINAGSKWKKSTV